MMPWDRPDMQPKFKPENSGDQKEPTPDESRPRFVDAMKVMGATFAFSYIVLPELLYYGFGKVVDLRSVDGRLFLSGILGCSSAVAPMIIGGFIYAVNKLASRK